MVRAESLEKLRKHEDGLISARNNIYLIVNALFVAATGIGDLSSNAKLIIAFFGMALSIFWFLSGIRHKVLMNWYNDEIIKMKSSCISKIHSYIRSWKKQNFWFIYTGNKIGLRVLNIMCLWIPGSFLVFWGFMLYCLIFD